MKKIIYIGIVLFCSVGFLRAQEQDSISSWDFKASASLYLFSDDFIGVGIFYADKNRLHLETRYNYEDLETFSGWIGYNFDGGDDVFSYAFTPMLGGVVGRSNAIAPGLEMTLTYKKFELYCEMENLYDPKDSGNNYFYNWADFTYSPTNWLWFGISGQRTRLYQTDLDFQRGLIVGGGFKRFKINNYLYNIDNDLFVILNMSIGF